MIEELTQMLKSNAENMKQIQKNPVATFKIKSTVKGKEIEIISNNLQLAVEGFEEFEKRVMKIGTKNR